MAQAKITIGTIGLTGGGRRFNTLDGLRGLAAIAVLVSHIAPALCDIPVLRNWYAVDLFFMISGFVLCRTYEPRFAQGLTPRQFMLQRYIRLYPLFALGVAFGMGAELLAVISGHSVFDSWQRMVAVITGLAILPSPTMAATPEIIPMNAVGWSLFFELVANYVYAVLWPRLDRTLLLSIIALSGAELLWSAYNGTSFGGVGWGTFWGGFPRVLFCFFVGVLIARVLKGQGHKTRLVWTLMLGLGVILLTPWHDADLRDVVIMMLVFPTILTLAAAWEPIKPHAFSLLGRISYPIYAVHYPIYLCLERGLDMLGVPVDRLAPWGGIVFFFIMFGSAILLDRHYDAVVRRALSRWVISDRNRPSPRNAAALTDDFVPKKFSESSRIVAKPLRPS